MATIRTFCTSKTEEILPGIFRIDAVLKRGNPKHEMVMSNFSTQMDSEMDTGNPQSVVLDTTGAEDIIRFKNETEKLVDIRVEALMINKELKEKDLKSGCTTSVIGTGGDPIKMDCDYQDGLNLIFLRDHSVDTMGMGLQETVTIKDFNNNYQVVTIAELNTIIQELRSHGLQLFQEKWTRENIINNATSFSTINEALGTDFS